MSRRRLPSVDRILQHAAMRDAVRDWGLKTVKSAVVALQADFRAADASDIPDWSADEGAYDPHVRAWLGAHVGHGYLPVFNLTGTIIHTNLGRSLLDPEMLSDVLTSATRPVTLEYDLAAGRRGDREGIVAHRLRLLTGAEAATVVNNNAAAVLLVLNTLARGKEVPVSRGELIEIGGSFRLPEVMERAGCTLREVGTTNRTHADDYRRAIGPDTALLLKAHPSNYRIEGFTREVSVRELASIAESRGLPVCIDAGSGALIDLSRFGLPREPLPQDFLAAGADLVTFSGDKLLGGPQAGIIVGRRDLVEQVNANPLKRALRLDKLALALLDATLKAYEDDEAVAKIPLLRNLAVSMGDLDRRADRVAKALKNIERAQVDTRPSQAQLGSGALPGELLESRAVTVGFAQEKQLRSLATALRRLQPPVIARIAEDRLVLDMRGAEPLDELVAILETLR
ncbi:MAG: L-seryl-tRNA(Sec) selenium transferase [Gammaproteobacteria bacterium]|nr:L-seryl-tRNA(Sec) selenium transferase [Gammaproteobacteria bacterium]